MTDHKMAAVDAGLVAYPVDTDFRLAPMGHRNPPRGTSDDASAQVGMSPVDNWQVVNVTSSYI